MVFVSGTLISVVGTWDESHAQGETVKEGLGDSSVGLCVST